MPIDAAALATTVVGNYLMPYVKKGLQKIGEEVKQKLDEAAAEHATKVTAKIWEKVKSLFGPKDEPLLDQLKQRPEVSQPLVEAVLRDKLNEDTEAAEDLDNLVRAQDPQGNGTAAQIMQSAGIAVAVVASDFRGASGVVIAGKVYGSPVTKKEN